MEILNFKLDKNLALFYGILMGDGCLCESGRHQFICISGHSKDDKEFHEDLIIPLIYKLIKRKVKCRKIKNKNCITIHFSNKDLFKKLVKLGFPIGKKGQGLIIPKIFYEKNLVRYIIQGFFATDGCITLTKNPNKFYPRIESQTIHKDLMLQITNYLNSKGLKGKFYKCSFTPDPRWRMSQDRYKFQFNGKINLILFDQLIGFINLKHKLRLINFINYDKEYEASRKINSGAARI